MNHKSTINLPPCPVCKSCDINYYFDQLTKIFSCDNCTHVYSDPTDRIGADHYDNDYYENSHHNWFSNPNIQLFTWILSQFSSNHKSLLDVGCGKGDFLRFTRSKYGSKMKLVGLDYTFNNNETGIEYRQGDLKDFPFNECYDVVVSLAVIEHVANPVSFATELVNRCNKGGFVIVMTLNNDSLLYIAARIMAKFKIYGPRNRLYSLHHTQHFTSKSLIQTLQQSNLEILKIHHHNTPIAALDIPVKNRFVKFIYKLGVLTLFWFGKIFNRTYLQTVIAKRTI